MELVFGVVVDEFVLCDEFGFLCLLVCELLWQIVVEGYIELEVNCVLCVVVMSYDLLYVFFFVVLLIYIVIM